MRNSVLSRFHIQLLLFLLLYSCAKVGMPSGGPRDRVPPVVVSTVPQALSTNYSGYKIEITLNEYVVLDNINENLLVSPPSQKNPKVWIKGKTVIAEYEEDLKDSTTYTFNFQNAIKDLNEGNILEDYQFVFSTGPVVDSLSVTGNVYYAENLEVPEKVFVLMHRNLADSAVKKQLPDYIGLIDRNGYFRINNVRPGSYRLYALKDADNNKRYNLKDEEFAFMGSPLEVTADSNWLPIVKDTVVVPKTTPAVRREPGTIEPDTIVLTGKNKLMLFTEPPTARFLKSSDRKMKYQLEYVLSLPPDTLDFDFEIPDTVRESYLVEMSRQKDTMVVWLTDSTLYNQNLIATYLKYPSLDSAEKIIYKQDTVQMRYVAPRTTRAPVIKKPAALTILNNMAAGLIKPGQEIMFRSETPLLPPDTSMIRLFDVTKKDTLPVPYTIIRDSLTATRYFFRADILPENKYFFVADSAAFSNYYGEYSDSIGLRLSMKPADSYGALKFNIINGEGDMIIQLLDKSEKLVLEDKRNGDGIIEFALLEPGSYRAKIIFDLNGDGKWTSGDFTAGRLPEPVSYYPAEIEVKAKFELEQDWDVAVRYLKDVKMRSVRK